MTRERRERLGTQMQAVAASAAVACFVALAVMAAVGIVRGTPAHATAPGVINYYDAVCSPDFATRCVKPNTDGSINVNLGGIASLGTITGNATGTTGAVVGTLAGAAAKTTYICGFNVSAIGGTAAVGPITVANLVTSNMVFELASTASGNQLTVPFTPCIPANAVNTAITVTTTADGTASAVAVNSWGFTQ